MRKTEKDSRNKAGAAVGETPLLRFLRQVPPEKLDRAIRRLKKTVPPADLRKAMEELIARAPFEQFPTLKDVYMRHDLHRAMQPAQALLWSLHFVLGDPANWSSKGEMPGTFSLAGAATMVMLRSTPPDYHAYAVAIHALTQVTDGKSAVYWSEMPRRTHAEMLQAIEDAIVSLEP